jgi:hypothetical protein
LQTFGIEELEPDFDFFFEFINEQLGNDSETEFLRERAERLKTNVTYSLDCSEDDIKKRKCVCLFVCLLVTGQRNILPLDL